MALPGYRTFAERHHYDLCVTRNRLFDWPAAWNKVPLLLDALERYDEVVWLDCDLVVVDPSEDFPKLNKAHALVRHFEAGSEVPNSGVWRLTRACSHLLNSMTDLHVFRNHGWWEQAALMTLMGYTVPPEGSHYPDTKCHSVVYTQWRVQCEFMRLCWNSHPNYRATKPRIVHCSYPSMPQRLEVMRELVKNPTFDYPRYDLQCPHCKTGKVEVGYEETDY